MNGGMSFVVAETPLKQRQSADAHKLVQGAVAGQVDVVFQHAMAAEQRTVGDDARVTDAAIVSDVGVGHQEIVVADARLPRVRRAPMDGDVLAEDVVVADFEARRFAVVFHVLRRFAEHDAAVDGVITAHVQRTKQVSARTNDAAGPQMNLALDDHVGADLDVVVDLGLRGDQGGGVNAGGFCDRHNGTRLERAIRIVPANQPTGADARGRR